MTKIKAIAINLPQFHPFEQNDKWWGKGFTEWTNVTKAAPRFKGHYQPHLPTDLGFYDLRLEETRNAQAELAKSYGIEGFCYYHYWFNGERLMNRPLDGMLQSGKPDFPFMFCWANENWTKRWDGEESNVLIQQNYSEEDDRKHINYLIKTFFADKRYIKVDDKPFFVVYRPALFPNIKQTAKVWREEAKKAGLKDLYLGYMNGFDYKVDPVEIGFDVAIDFQPDFYSFPNPINKHKSLLEAIGLKKYRPHNKVDRHFSYDQIMDQMLKNIKAKNYKIYPGLFPMWDNSARRVKGAEIILGATPEKYGEWLRKLLQQFKPYSAQENFVFINAWNEWAEGNHLEPCIKWGRQYLETTRSVLEEHEKGKA